MGIIDGPERTKVQSVEVPVTAPKISPTLIATTIIYLIAIINASAAVFGYDFNIEAHEDKIYEGVTILFTIGSFALGVWRNNNYTKGARIKEAAAEQIVVEDK